MDAVSGADSRVYVNTDTVVAEPALTPPSDPPLPARRVVGGLTNDTLWYGHNKKSTRTRRRERVLEIVTIVFGIS